MIDTTPGPVPPYAELHCRSCFSFLTGASRPAELVDEAIGFIDRFIATPFSGEERHARRLAMLEAYEAEHLR